MQPAVGPVDEVQFQLLATIPARHHDIACLDISVTAFLVYILQSLWSYHDSIDVHLCQPTVAAEIQQEATFATQPRMHSCN